ncbi:MAG: DUF11 domain-containing protein [Candidatus Nomurabacteria bacterium]|jgi:uncharacterized repeat protein (TIGR01451 family)/LPXTG-motif cell wall-anchored protein|nr:DUF11 domain-containing protein [Candidatus Nomurabacteria bacterium]
MNKILKASAGIVAAAAITVTSAISAFAWGPSRPTFTLAKPSSYITFNSITDNNKEVGDERYFVSASPYTGNAANNKWTDSTTVEDGKEYVVRMYVHNNAGSNLNLIAENVRAYIVLPTTTGTAVTVSGKIYASNANPTTVWDDTTFKSTDGKKFNLAYVDGSAKYYNTAKNGTLRTFSLDGLNDSNDLFTDKGKLLGYDAMDGKIPGCIEYSGYVTFHVKAQFEAVPGTTVTKEVQVDGAQAWSESVTAKAGDKINYRIHFKNSGEVAMKNVLIRDILPAGLTYVKGSTEVYNEKNPDGGKGKISDNIVSGTGINIGDYSPGAGAWIYFSATVDKSVSEKCNNSILWNVVQANGGYGTQEAKAAVGVTGKVCKEEPETPKPTPPTTLPKTGPGAVAGAIVGAGSLVTAGAYYIISRKK